MDQQYYSIKQMADMLSVSKQRVYRCIKQNHIIEAHHETVRGNTVLMYSHDDFLRIKGVLNGNGTSNEAHQEAHHETVNEALYEALVKQLEAKDKQIEQLQKALDQEQRLHLLSKQRILELEARPEASPEQPEQETNQDATDPEPPRSFWARLFGR